MSAAPASSDSPYFHGLLAPVDDEREDLDLEIEGEIPAGLNGIFVRNGPNPQFRPEGAYHPFDGDGMLHAVYFEDGRARYKNRWIESKGLLAERKRGRACYGSIGEFKPPAQDVMEEAGMMKNNANTHFIRHAGRYFALMEAGQPTQTTRELETLGECDFDGKLVGPMTAHPKIDPVTGELIFFAYSPVPPYLRYHVVDASGALVHSIEIDIPNPVMIHDFAVTEHYAVFLDSPAVFDLESMLSGGSAISWKPELGTRMGILPRRGGPEAIRWFEVPTCNIVHFFNAWDEDGVVHVHAPAFPEMPGAFDFANPVAASEPVPWHWAVDLESSAVSARQTDDRSGEFPRINDEHAAHKTRYLYNSRARSWEFDFDFHGVVKYDLESGAAEEFFHGETAVSGEHVFAPDPAGSGEDDGWLLSMVSDRATEQSHLAVLDARNPSAGPLAKVGIPRRVPLGFHANWLAES
jgi:carotenoid cleavage dioxygenase-like enzyme